MSEVGGAGAAAITYPGDIEREKNTAARIVKPRAGCSYGADMNVCVLQKRLWCIGWTSKRPEIKFD